MLDLILKMGHPRPLFRLFFGLFKHQYNVENDASSMGHSNSRHGSRSIPTRPGLLSLKQDLLEANIFAWGQWPMYLVITWVVLLLFWHLVNLLLGCISGLNLVADLGPVLALLFRKESLQIISLSAFKVELCQVIELFSFSSASCSEISFTALDQTIFFS